MSAYRQLRDRPGGDRRGHPALDGEPLVPAGGHRQTCAHRTTIAFWVLFIAVVVLLFQDRNDAGREEVQVEGPGLHPLPVLEHAGRAVLAADPAVPRLLVARGGWHKIDRRRLDRRRRGAAGLLDRARSTSRRPGPAADLLRVVPRLHQPAAQQPPRGVVRLADRLRRARRRRSASSSARLSGVGRVLRGADEHVVPARRLRLHQPGPLHDGDRADAGLEGRRLLRPRPLPPADARHPVASPRGDGQARHRADPSPG